MRKWRTAVLQARVPPVDSFTRFLQPTPPDKHPLLTVSEPRRSPGINHGWTATGVCCRLRHRVSYSHRSAARPRRGAWGVSDGRRVAGDCQCQQRGDWVCVCLPLWTLPSELAGYASRDYRALSRLHSETNTAISSGLLRPTRPLRISSQVSGFA